MKHPSGYSCATCVLLRVPEVGEAYCGATCVVQNGPAAIPEDGIAEYCPFAHVFDRIADLERALAGRSPDASDLALTAGEERALVAGRADPADTAGISFPAQSPHPSIPSMNIAVDPVGNAWLTVVAPLPASVVKVALGNIVEAMGTLDLYNPAGMAWPRTRPAEEWLAAMPCIRVVLWRKALAPGFLASVETGD